jgi:Ala-tRNA(Pro) deacylase
MPHTRASLLAYLDGLGIPHKTYDHPAVYTVAESLAIEKTMPGGHTKNLFLKDKKDAVFLIAALHDARIDLKTLHKVLGCDRLSFGKPELLEEVLGVRPGSVTPFSLINDASGRANVILDAAMMEHELLNYHPLENTATTAIARDDLLRFIRATGHEPRILGVSDGKIPRAPSVEPVG